MYRTISKPGIIASTVVSVLALLVSVSVFDGGSSWAEECEAQEDDCALVDNDDLVTTSPDVFNITLTASWDLTEDPAMGIVVVQPNSQGSYNLLLNTVSYNPSFWNPGCTGTREIDASGKVDDETAPAAVLGTELHIGNCDTMWPAAVWP